MTSKIAQIIDRERTKLGLSQIEVLKKAELNPKAYGREWARLRSNRIGISDLLALCKAVKVDLAIYDGSTRMKWSTFKEINMPFKDVLQVCKGWEFEVIASRSGLGNLIDGELIPDEKINLQGRRK